MKSRFSPFLYSGLFSVVSILSFPQITLAQLRLGTGIQPGLEGYVLEYQQQGLPLNELRGTSACSVGFGASCNKTGAILQKIVKEHSGLDYQKLLIKAAGGEENYQRFTQLYNHPSAVSATPYSSFWRDGNKYILDSYEYSGIGTLNGLDTSSIKETTSKFKYSSISLRNEVVTPRQGLIELKLSYGLTLMEEALKVPNINQKIAEMSLDANETSYHRQNFNNAVAVLSSNSSGTKKNRLFQILSSPYNTVAAPLNRPNLNISKATADVDGISLPGEEINETTGASFIEEGDEVFVLSSFNEIIEVPGASSSLYAIAGISGIALILLLLGDSDSEGDSVDSVIAAASPEVEEGQAVVIENNSDPIEEDLITSKIPEPSRSDYFFLLLGIFFLLKRKKVIMRSLHN